MKKLITLMLSLSTLSLCAQPKNTFSISYGLFKGVEYFPDTPGTLLQADYMRDIGGGFELGILIGTAQNHSGHTAQPQFHERSFNMMSMPFFGGISISMRPVNTKVYSLAFGLTPMIAQMKHVRPTSNNWYYSEVIIDGVLFGGWRYDYENKLRAGVRFHIRNILKISENFWLHLDASIMKFQNEYNALTLNPGVTIGL
ncbi:MAG: hypothetical protein LBC98_00535 [Prevotellaceae bacterium]|jgi:hypothetical protein|nr:hypothetical protein [Prevotellaceae bacterium]